MKKKILVIGSPGSGKSYFSKELSRITNIPVYHLDLFYWNENWVSTPKDIFDLKQKEIMSNDSWIIDGNYQRTLQMRLEQAELVFFLDLPVDICVKAEQERRGIPRSDFPSYLNEGEDPEFVTYIKEFPIGRQKIVTFVMKNNQIKDVLGMLLEDLKKKHQIYVIAPMIDGENSDAENADKQ